MSVICLVLGGVVRVRLYVIYAHLCNDILLSSGGGTWGTALYTVRGVGSGSRDVDTWRANGSVRGGPGVPSTDDPGTRRCLFRSHGLLDWSTLSLSGNKTHTTRRWMSFCGGGEGLMRVAKAVHLHTSPHVSIK